MGEHHEPLRHDQVCLPSSILTDCCTRPTPSWNVALLRYFNPIGRPPSGLMGEDPNGIPNNLLPYIAQGGRRQAAARSTSLATTIPRPDGTGVRDYIHVCRPGPRPCRRASRRWRNGRERCSRSATSAPATATAVLHDHRGLQRRPAARSSPTSSTRAAPATWPSDWRRLPSKAKRELGWEAQYGIEEMCAHSWNWQSHNPDGYKTAK